MDNSKPSGQHRRFGPAAPGKEAVMHERDSRCRWRVGIVAGLILMSGALPAHAARGFLYRSAATGRWTKLAILHDPLPPSSAFASQTFLSFSSSTRAAIATVAAGACGPDAITLATFSGIVDLSAHNTGIFLFDATTAGIHDVAIEHTATPLGGTWASLSYENPVVVIDGGSCAAHVVFRGELASGQPANQRTGLFDATFALPSLTPTGTAVLVQEGVTVPGAPFPAAAELDALVPRTSYSAALDAGGNLVVAFAGRARTHGVTDADDSAIFAVSPSGFGFTTVLHEGDPSCVPPWPGAGPVYHDFLYKTPVSVAPLSAPSTPSVLVVAYSTGTPVVADSAVVLNTGGCAGTTAVVASEAGAAPSSGTYSQFSPWRAKTNAAGDSAFVGFAKFPDAPTISRLTLVRSSTGTITRTNPADSAFGRLVPFPLVSSFDMGLNAASDLAFGAHPILSPGFLEACFLSPGNGDPLQVLTPDAFNPQIDDFGNITALFR